MTPEQQRKDYKPVIAFLEPMPIEIVSKTMQVLIDVTNATDTTFDIIDSDAFDEIGATVLIARQK